MEKTTLKKAYKTTETPQELYVLSYKKPTIQALAARGVISQSNTQEENISAARDFINPAYKLADPFLFKKMADVVSSLESAIKNGSKIVIYGDYDVDGLSASALLLDALSSLGATAEIYIPSRHQEGYGLNKEALADIQLKGAKLVITVDCGVTAFEEVEYAKELGLEMIITDHHSLPDKLPECLILHPLVDSEYPFKDFCGAGVAFTLGRALISKLATEGDREGAEKWLLDLAVLGTIADVVPLIGENRVIAKYGLLVLGKTKRPGLKALLATHNSRLTAHNSQLTDRTVGFVIGPRLNASGRLKHAIEAIEILTTTDSVKAAKLANTLENMNEERKKITNSMVQDARSMVREFGDRSAYLLSSKNFNPGVAGIVAARLSEETSVPVLVCEENPKGFKGSARAPKGYDIISALRLAPHCFMAVGGHAGAAGFTIEPTKAGELSEHIHNVFGAAKVSVQTEVDGELSVGDITIQAAEELEGLSPFGHSNPQPVFKVSGTAKFVKKVGADSSHLKLMLEESGKRVDVIGFNLAKAGISEGDQVEVLGCIDINEFNGRRSVQIRATDIRKSDED